MLREISGQAIFAGFLAAVVGFASSFPVVLQGLASVDATSAEATSGLMALSVGMGLCGVYLSFRTRQPVSVAWSTPGAALLATVPLAEGGFAVAVGAFLVSGVLIVIAGLWKPLGRWVGAIPSSIASAMLAGVLFDFCLGPFRAVAELPVPALCIVTVWAVMIRVRRLFAMPVTVFAAVVLIAVTTDHGLFSDGVVFAEPVWIMPVFSFPAVVSIAVPLFIVTMASQNIPGVAVLNANGYRPDAAGLFRVTGLFGLLAAPFGGHAINLAAITASMVAGPDAHIDPARRYWAAITNGVFYVLFGSLAGLAITVVTIAQPAIVMAVAGLALLGAFGSSITRAMVVSEDREAALVAFLLSASGLSFLEIGGAFWGLIAGIVVYHLLRFRRQG